MKSKEEILHLVNLDKDELREEILKLGFDGKPRFMKHELCAFRLLSIKRPMNIIMLTQVSFLKLQELINNPIYNHFCIEKKKGGKRQIYAPNRDLKRLQQRLNFDLQGYYLAIKPAEVHGFVINPRFLGKQSNIVENAKPHVGKKHILNIDLKDFFPSITALRVKQMFSASYFNFNDQIATALTLLTTYKGFLPIGAPTSPVISNFICLWLDKDLKDYSEINGLSFTRYADDLTFSSDIFISKEKILEIRTIIEKNNFNVNEKKLRLRSSNRQQTVTGLVVNEKVNIDRKLLKKIRAMLHDFRCNGLEVAAMRHFRFKIAQDRRNFLNVDALKETYKKQFLQRLAGYVNFVGQVRPKGDRMAIMFKFSFDKSCEYEM
jgi:RNA-directed DNA polymerase